MIRRILSTAVLGAATLLPTLARAQDAPADSVPLVRVPAIVVTATRTPAPAGRIASAITVVSREEIERRQYRTVAEALRDVAGVAVTRGGGEGGVTSAFLRGAASDHTLVLVDGVEMNDPSSPSAAFDLALLPTDNVERIEILRGPQSALYGSAAMGGVVQVFTREGAGATRADLSAEGGAFGSVLTRASASGQSGAVRWSASAHRRETGGISAAAGGTEDDGHERTAVSARGTWSPDSATALTVQLRGERGETEFDQGGGAGADDPNAVAEAQELGVLVEASRASARRGWIQRLSLGITSHDRDSRDEPDEARPQDRSRGVFDGAKVKASWLHELRVGAPGRLVFGVETERESARTRFVSESAFGPFESEFPPASAWTTGAFVEHRHAISPALDVSGSVRVDRHSRFGHAGTFRATAGWRTAPAGPRLTATWGTGFKAPTLFQLFDPQFGNSALEPEKSIGWDVGAKQSLAEDRVQLGAALFGARFDELVQFETAGFRNIAQARARGIETSVSVMPQAAVSMHATYTYTHTEDRSGGADHGTDLLRRPRHAGTVTIELAPGERADFALVVSGVGERVDLDFSTFPATRTTLAAHALVRIAASLRLHERVRVHARLENALDADVVEVLGFGAPGRAFYGGLTLGF